MITETQANNRSAALATSVIHELLIVKHALYDNEIRLAQDTVEELITRLKRI